MGNTFSCLFPKKKDDSTSSICRPSRKDQRGSKRNDYAEAVLRRDKRDEDDWEIEDLENDDTSNTETESNHRRTRNDLTSSPEAAADKALGPSSSTDITQHDSVDSGIADVSSSYQDLLKNDSSQLGYPREIQPRHYRRTKDSDSIPMSLRQVNEDYSKRINKQRQMTRALLKLQKSPSPVRKDPTARESNGENDRANTDDPQEYVTWEVEEENKYFEFKQHQNNDREATVEATEGDTGGSKIETKVNVTVRVSDEIKNDTFERMRDWHETNVSNGMELIVGDANSKSINAYNTPQSNDTESHKSNGAALAVDEGQTVSNFCKLQKTPSPVSPLSNVGKEVLLINEKDDTTDESLRRLRDAFFQEFLTDDEEISPAHSLNSTRKEPVLLVAEKDDDIPGENLRRLKNAFYQEFLIEDQEGDFIASNSRTSSKIFPLVKDDDIPDENLKRLKNAFYQEFLIEDQEGDFIASNSRTSSKMFPLVKDTEFSECMIMSKKEATEYGNFTTELASNNLHGLCDASVDMYDDIDTMKVSGESSDSTGENEAGDCLVNEVNEFKTTYKNKTEQLLRKHKKHDLVTIFEDNAEEEKAEIEDFCMHIIQRCLDLIKFEINVDGSSEAIPMMKTRLKHTDDRKAINIRHSDDTYSNPNHGIVENHYKERSTLNESLKLTTLGHNSSFETPYSQEYNEVDKTHTIIEIETFTDCTENDIKQYRSICIDNTNELTREDHRRKPVTIVKNTIGENKKELEDYCIHILHQCVDAIDFVTDNTGGCDSLRDIKTSEEMTERCQKIDKQDCQCIGNIKNVIFIVDREGMITSREINEKSEQKHKTCEGITACGMCEEVQDGEASISEIGRDVTEENLPVNGNHTAKEKNYAGKDNCDNTILGKNDGLCDDTKKGFRFDNREGNKDIIYSQMTREETETLKVNKTKETNGLKTYGINEEDTGHAMSKDQTTINMTKEQQRIKYSPDTDVLLDWSRNDPPNAPKDTYTVTVRENTETVISDMQKQNIMDNDLKPESARTRREHKRKATVSPISDKRIELMNPNSRQLGQTAKTKKQKGVEIDKVVSKNVSDQKRQMKLSKTRSEIKPACVKSTMAKCSEDTKLLTKSSIKDKEKIDVSKSRTRTREHMKSEVPKVALELGKHRTAGSPKAISTSIPVVQSTTEKRKAASARTSKRSTCGKKKAHGIDNELVVLKTDRVDEKGQKHDDQQEDKKCEIVKQRGPDRGIVWPQKMEDLYSAEDRAYYVDQFQRTEMFRQRLKRKQQNNNAWSRALSQFQTWVIEHVGTEEMEATLHPKVKRRPNKTRAKVSCWRGQNPLP